LVGWFSFSSWQLIFLYDFERGVSSTTMNFVFAVARRTPCLSVFSRIVVVEVVEGGSVAEVGDALNGAPTKTKRKKGAIEGKAMCE
jgi:hypothetical protein